MKRKLSEAGIAMSGALQTLINLVPNKPEQAEMLVCQICGHTWSCSDADTIKKSWRLHERTVRGPLCDICWHLWSVTNQAHARGLSLQRAVFRFLRGRGKQLHIEWKNIWTSPR